MSGMCVFHLQMVEVELVKDPDPPSCPGPSPAVTALSNQVIIEASVKQEPPDPESAMTTEVTQPCQCQCGADVLPNSQGCFCNNQGGEIISTGTDARKGGACGSVDTDVRIKEEPPDDYETEGRPGGVDSTQAQAEACQARLPPGQQIKSEVCEELSLSSHSAGQQTSDCGVSPRVGHENVCDASRCLVPTKVDLSRTDSGVASESESVERLRTSSSGGAVSAQDGTPRPVPCLVKTSCLPNVVPKTGTAVSSAVSGMASNVVPSAASSPRTVVSVPQPLQAKADPLLPGSKATSLLSGLPGSKTTSLLSGLPGSKTTSLLSGLPGSSYTTASLLSRSQALKSAQPSPKGGDGAKTSSPSVPPMQVLLVDPSTFIGKTLVAGTSLLAPGTTSVKLVKPGEGKVTTAGGGGSLPRLQVTSQGLKPIVANGPMKKPPVSCQTAFRQLPGDGGASVASTLAQSQNASALPPVNHGSCQSGRPIPAVGAGNVSQLSGSGMRSLLNTAPQPAIQALLQRLVSTAGSSPGTWSSPSIHSGTTFPSTSSSSSSSPAATTVSPGESYIIANVNNRRVLMRIDSSSLRVHPSRDAKLVAQASGGPSSVSTATLTPGSTVSVLLNAPSPALVSSPSTTTTTTTTHQSFLQRIASAGSLSSSSLALRTATTAARQQQRQQPPQQQLLVDRSNGQGGRSLAGLELAKAKAKAAVLRSVSQRVVSKAAVQLARLKAAARESRQAEATPPPPPKSRCARWFSEGLGSNLVPLVTRHGAGTEQPQNGLAEDRLPPKTAAVEVKVVGRPDDEAEKKIMVLKKKMEGCSFAMNLVAGLRWVSVGFFYA